MSHIYVCSLSSPFNCSQAAQKRGLRNLSKLGHSVTFSHHAFDADGNVPTSIANRLSDLAAGFANPDYDVVTTTRGGWNSNELLPFVDYRLIRRHTKPFVGMSDMTTLCVNLWQRSGIPTYYGMMFRHFTSSLNPSDIQDSDSPFGNRAFNGFYRNGIKPENILRGGTMSGVLVGGNLAVLCWLLGTPYALRIPEGAILFLEDDDETNGYYWQMYLTHLKHSGAFERVSGVVFGRVLPKTRFNSGSDFIAIVNDVLAGYDFPILIDADFGHIDLPITIPFGMQYKLECNL